MSPEKQKKAEESRALSNEGRDEDGKSPKTATHSASAKYIFSAVSQSAVLLGQRCYFSWHWYCRGIRRLTGCEKLVLA